jgi:hypothetical protein
LPKRAYMRRNRTAKPDFQADLYGDKISRYAALLCRLEVSRAGPVTANEGTTRSNGRIRRLNRAQTQIAGYATAVLWAIATLLHPGPMYAPRFLVAGEGPAGYTDGKFDEARFSSPRSIIISANRNLLYVSDFGNNCLREIHLDEACRVSTLCGVTSSGKVDGDSTTARLNHPGRLRLSNDGKTLYFLDQDGTSLRAMDLISSTVKTVLELSSMTGGLGVGCFDLNLAENGIYFNVAAQNALLFSSLDGKVTRTVAVDPLYGLPNFSFHTLEGNFYYIRTDSGQVYGVPEIVLGSGPPPPVPVSLMGPFPGFMYMDKSNDGTTAFLVGFNAATNLFHLVSIPQFGPSTCNLEDLNGIGPEELAHSTRPMLMGNLAFSFDYPSMTIYVAETASNRIMGFHTIDRANIAPLDGNGIQATYFTEKKAPSTKRNVLVGSSISFVSETTTASLLFPKQLEEYWNLFNYLSGQNEQEEVIFQGTHMGFQAGGGLSFSMGYKNSWSNVHADRVILTVTYLDVISEAMTFMKAPTPDDIAPAYVDNEWMTQTEIQRNKATGPLSLAFKRDLGKVITSLSPGSYVNKDGGIFDPGQWNQQILFNDPKLRDDMLAIYRRRLKAFLAEAKKQGAVVIGALLPLRNQLTLTEMVGGGRNFSSTLAPASIDTALGDIFASEGVPLFNLTKEIRVLDSAYFPLVKWSDDHYNSRGHKIMGLTLAWKLSEAGRPGAAMPIK